MYALGVVAYECLAGRRPFDRDHPIAVAIAHQCTPAPPPPQVPAPVRRLVGRMLAKDPARRPPSAAAVAHEALAVRGLLGRHWHEGAGLAAPALGLGTPAPKLPASGGTHAVATRQSHQLRPRRRRRLPAVLTLVSLLLALLLLNVGRAHTRPGQPVTAQAAPSMHLGPLGSLGQPLPGPWLAGPAGAATSAPTPTRSPTPIVGAGTAVVAFAIPSHGHDGRRHSHNNGHSNGQGKQPDHDKNHHGHAD